MPGIKKARSFTKQGSRTIKVKGGTKTVRVKAHVNKLKAGGTFKKR